MAEAVYKHLSFELKLQKETFQLQTNKMQLRTLTCLGFVLAVICLLQMAPGAEVSCRHNCNATVVYNILPLSSLQSCLPILINPIEKVIDAKCKFVSLFPWQPFAKQCKLAPVYFDLIREVCSVCLSIAPSENSKSSTTTSTTTPAA